MSAQHGTYTMYASGCRCDPCRAYQNGRVARNRAERLASGALSHGRRSAFDAGCRCADCRKVRRDYYRAKEAVRKPLRDVVCATCGTEFTADHPLTKFCSDECRRRKVSRWPTVAELFGATS